MTKVWLITGSSRGLGRNLAEAALEQGHSVVATARDPKSLASLAEHYGDRILPIVGDFAKHLDLPSVMMGFGLPDDNLHAPNEKFLIANFYQGTESIIRFLERVALVADAPTR